MAAVAGLVNGSASVLPPTSFMRPPFLLILFLIPCVPNSLSFSPQETALVAAVAGLVNGSASAGAVAQSLVASQFVKILGWGGLFALLGVLMIGASLALRSAVAIEADALAKKKAA